MDPLEGTVYDKVPHRPHFFYTKSQLVDQWLDEQEASGIRPQLLVKVRDHYKVGNPNWLRGLLLSRQLLLIDALTDYTKSESEVELRNLLRAMNAHISGVIGRMYEKMDQLDQALADAKVIHAEATRILADYKARCNEKSASSQS